MGDAELRRLVQQPTNPRVARLRAAGRVRGSLLRLQRVRKSARVGNDLVSRKPGTIHSLDLSVNSANLKPHWVGDRRASHDHTCSSKWLPIPISLEGRRDCSQSSTKLSGTKSQTASRNSLNAFSVPGRCPFRS